MMCTTSCAKYVLIVFNCLFWFGGCALLGGGIALKVHPTVLSYQSIINISGSDPLVLHAANIFIAVGAVAFIIGFLGCCGALKEQRLFLLAYGTLLAMIMIVEVAAVVLVIVYRTRVEQLVKRELIQKLRHGYFAESAIKKTMDALQIQAAIFDLPLIRTSDSMCTSVVVLLDPENVGLGGECCGIVNFTDFVGSRWQNESKDYVPESCCTQEWDESTSKPKVKNDGRCQQEARSHNIESDFFNFKGCYIEIEEWIYQHTSAMLILAAAVVVLEIIGLIVSCCLRDLLSENQGKEDS